MASASSPVEVLLTGATGYIGGSVLHALLERKDNRHRFHVTALVRSKDAATKLTSALANGRHHQGTPLLGSLDDFDLLANAADKADVVIHTADADHLTGIDAITTGLARRRAGGGDGRRRGILIHTSGTGELVRQVKGEHGQQEPVSDLDMATIHSIPLTQVHRNVDALIFERVGGEAGGDEVFDSFIVCPPTIYGRGLGLFNRTSVQLPGLIRAIAAHGQAVTVGKGLNVWDHVHIEDLVDLYLLILDKSLEGSADKGRQGGWYFAENGHYVLKDVVARVAEVLHKRGVIPTSQVVPFKDDTEAEKVLGPYWAYFGTNSRSRADRSRRLGWAPTRGTADLLASIEEEVDALLRQKEASV